MGLYLFAGCGDGSNYGHLLYYLDASRDPLQYSDRSCTGFAAIQLRPHPESTTKYSSFVRSRPRDAADDPSSSSLLLRPPP